MTRAKLQIKKPGGPNRDEKNSVKTYDDREKKTSRQDFQGNQLVILNKYIDSNLIPQDLQTYELFSHVYQDYIKFCYDLYFHTKDKPFNQLFEDDENPNFLSEKRIHRLKSYNIAFLSKKKFSQALEFCLKTKPEMNIVKTRSQHVILRGVVLKNALPEGSFTHLCGSKNSSN